MKAPFIVRQNLGSLLAGRKETAAALARYVGKHKTWMSQFLTGKRSELQLSDLDKIADFFGIATYQLFQPGISTLTERRSRTDRRTGRDRRIGHDVRMLGGLRTELNKLPSVHSSHANPPVRAGGESVPEPVRAILADAERRIAVYYAESGRQAPSPRASRAHVSKSR